MRKAPRGVDTGRHGLHAPDCSVSGSAAGPSWALLGTPGTARAELGRDPRSFAFTGHIIFFRDERDAFTVVNVIEGHRDIESLLA